MLIWVKTNMGNFTIQNMNEGDTIKKLKLEVLKKMIHKIPRIKNISVNRLRLRNNSGITLVNNKIHSISPPLSKKINDISVDCVYETILKKI